MLGFHEKFIQDTNIFWCLVLSNDNLVNQCTQYMYKILMFSKNIDPYNMTYKTHTFWMTQKSCFDIVTTQCILFVYIPL